LKKKIAAILILCLLLSAALPVFALKKTGSRVLTGFAYDENGEKTNDVVVTLNEIANTSGKTVSAYGDVKVGDITWMFASVGYEIAGETTFLLGKFSRIDNFGETTECDGEIVIVNKADVVSGYINGGRNSFINFTAGKDKLSSVAVNEYFKKNKIGPKNEVESVNEFAALEENASGVDSLLDGESNIRLTTSNTYMVMQVVGVPGLYTTENAAWYTIRSMLKTNYGDYVDVYAVRGQYNYVDPDQQTVGLDVTGVSQPKSVLSNVSITIGYAPIDGAIQVLQFLCTRTSNAARKELSNVSNYSSHFKSEDHYWNGSWANARGLGGEFAIQMSGGSVPGTPYTAFVQSTYQLYDIYNYVYTYRDLTGTISINCR